MNVADRIRLGEVQEIIVAAQVSVPVGIARTSERGLVELLVLDHCAHGAVEHEDALACGLCQCGAHGATVGDLVS